MPLLIANANISPAMGSRSRESPEKTVPVAGACRLRHLNHPFDLAGSGPWFLWNCTYKSHICQSGGKYNIPIILAAFYSNILLWSLFVLYTGWRSKEQTIPHLFSALLISSPWWSWNTCRTNWPFVDDLLILIINQKFWFSMATVDCMLKCQRIIEMSSGGDFFLCRSQGDLQVQPATRLNQRELWQMWGGI